MQQQRLIAEPLALQELRTLWAVWPVVRKWPGLRGEPKLVWLKLYELSRCGAERIVVTPSAIAAEQGCSDSASGRRGLNAVIECGLAKLIDRVEGRWEIELPDPREVVKARKTAGDPQFLLFELDEPDTRAESPAATPLRLVRTAKQAESPPRHDGGGSAGTSAVAPIARALDALAGMWSDDVGLAQRTHELTVWLLGQLGDEKTRYQAIAPYAAAIVEGRLKRSGVLGALADTQRKRRAGELIKTPGAYFMRAIQRLARQAGADENH